MTAPTMPLRANDHHQANDIEEAERAHLTAVLGQVRVAVARSGALAARTEESHREAGAQLAASRGELAPEEAHLSAFELNRLDAQARSEERRVGKECGS